MDARTAHLQSGIRGDVRVRFHVFSEDRTRDRSLPSVHDGLSVLPAWSNARELRSWRYLHAWIWRKHLCQFPFWLPDPDSEGLATGERRFALAVLWNLFSGRLESDGPAYSKPRCPLRYSAALPRCE